MTRKIVNIVTRFSSQWESVKKENEHIKNKLNLEQTGKGGKVKI